MAGTNEPIDSILVPTDGSDGAIAGAKRGLDLAVAVEADVHVLSVADTSELDGESSVLGDDVDEVREAIESEAEAAVEAVETLARDRGLERAVTTAIEHGTPFRVVESYVDDEGIDVVAMGTKGRTGLGRVVLGSVTENVLRTVDVPVLAVPPNAGDVSLTPEATEDVLLPTDGSEGAAAAVDWGVGLAETFDATVHALYSADTSRLAGSAAPSTVLTNLERAGQEALETVRERAKTRGVTVRGTVASGPPARTILDYADDEGIDLLVLGTHGRSGLERHLLGSVTENVVRNADVPVFCVPMPDE